MPEIRPFPIRDAFTSLTSGLQFAGSVLAILVGYGVVSTVQGDAITGIIGAAPGVVSLISDLLRAFRVRKAIAEAEAEVTPVFAPRNNAGEKLVATNESGGNLGTTY